MHKADTKLKIGTLYAGLRTDRKFTMHFTVWFLIRRLLMVTVLTCFPLLPVQIYLNQWLSILTICYLATYKPYAPPTGHTTDLCNELWLMFSTNCLLLFTEATPRSHHYNYGVAYVILFALSLVSNFGTVVVSYCRAKYALQKAKKNRIAARMIRVKSRMTWHT